MDEHSERVQGASAADAPTRGGSRWLREQLGAEQATHGIYIEIVVLAVILALESKRASDRDILSSVVGAIVAVALVELYAYYIGTMIGAGRRPTRDELRVALVSTCASLLAIVPPLFLLTLGVVGAIRLETGFTAAKWSGVAVIGVYALLAHRRAGLSTSRALPSAVFLALVGLGLVMLKQSFH